MKVTKIPEATVMRLSVYSRYLKEVEAQNIVNISSGEIAEGVGGTPAQVRKDLAYFGDFGTRGVGYNVRHLNEQILEILGLNLKWKVILIGAGNLGSALSYYQGFKNRGFEIAAVFDNDLNKVGLMLNGLPIYPITKMKDFIAEKDIELAIITVPSHAAQDVADLLSETNIKGILNFSPAILSFPDEIEVRNVDLTVNLEVLSFNIKNTDICSSDLC